MGFSAQNGMNLQFSITWLYLIEHYISNKMFRGQFSTTQEFALNFPSFG